MLGGLDPILIFYVSKVSLETEAKLKEIPLISKVYNSIGLPPIPIYLSESATGIYIDTEEKSIDIETEIEQVPYEKNPRTFQKAINSTVRIQMKAKSDSLGLILLSSLCDLVLPKVSGGDSEYSISYLHKSTTVFGGKLHSFSVSASTDNDLLSVNFELVKTSKLPEPTTETVTVTNEAGSTSILGQSQAPTEPLSTPLKQPPVKTPPGSAAPIKIGGPA